MDGSVFMISEGMPLKFREITERPKKAESPTAELRNYSDRASGVARGHVLACPEPWGADGSVTTSGTATLARGKKQKSTEEDTVANITESDSAPAAC